jgi:protein-disulfide isomerase
VIPELLEQYVDTGKVRYVYREYPLPSLHPNAQRASEAAVCAGLQDKYWEMNEHLFATSAAWGAEDVADPDSQFEAFAEELGLDTKAFNECLASGEAEIAVLGDMMAGQAAGVNATPFFFVNDMAIRGGLPMDVLGRIIDYAVAGGSTPSIEPPPDDWRNLGDVQAKAKMVAFVDFTNPESAQHATEVLPQLVDEYIDSGQLLYIIQPWSEAAGSVSAQAAAAAECVGQQGQYWEMHELLFAEQDGWTSASEPGALFSEYADSLGLDSGEFDECLDSEWAALRAESGPVIASLHGVAAAPVFLFNNGQGQQGSPSFEELQTVVESILNQ